MKKSPIKIVGPVLGFEIKEAKNHLIAIFFNLHNISKEIWGKGWIRIELKGLRKIKPSQRLFNIYLQEYPYKKIIGITHSIPACDLVPDYYEIRLMLFNGNERMVTEAKEKFKISSQEIIPL